MSSLLITIFIGGMKTWKTKNGGLFLRFVLHNVTGLAI